MAVASLQIDYTNVEALIASRPDISSIDNVNSSVMANVISQMEAKINAKLAKNYEVPVSDACPVLTAISTNLSIWGTLRIAYSQETLKDDPIFQTYKECWDDLDDIAAGKSDLITSSGSAVTRKTSGRRYYSNNRGYEPTYKYGRDEVSQVVDPDLINDVASYA